MVQKKSNSLPSQEDLFRFLVVSKVLSRISQGHSRSQSVKFVAAVDHFHPGGRRRRVSVRTLHRWVQAYKAGGIAGLRRLPRSQPETSVLPDKLIDFSLKEKEKDEKISIPMIIKKARELLIIPRHLAVDRSTLYRTLKRRGVSVRRKREPNAAKLRFEYENRMQMMLCDGKHFRAGAGRHRRVAFFYLDDATRFGLDVIVGTSENKELFLRGLYDVICGFGLPSMIYLDRGSGFIAHESAHVIGNLGSILIYGTGGYPEGRGKIERFNRTATQQVLRHFDGRADINPDCESLRLRLRHWLKNDYNKTRHESLKQEPITRFYNDQTPLRFPENEQELKEKFMITFSRLVSNDNVISVDGDFYEMPRGHAGERVLIHHRLLLDDIMFIHDGRYIKLHPVDKAFNARLKRQHSSHPEDTAQPLPPSAADIAFNNDFKPIVDIDGGFEASEGNDKEKKQ